MAISGADTAKVNAVLTTTLDRYSPQISNEIARNDGIVAMFGLNGAIKVVTGGERAIETLDTAENPNFGFRSKYSDIPIGRADTRMQAKYAWATLDGAVAINSIEQAMNAGESKIYDLVAADVDNAKNTLIRKLADALRASSPSATDPESILTIIPDTATASQTTSTGELSRATYSFWRSQYSNTSYDVSAATGLEGLMAFYLDSCSKGSSKLDQPDFALTTGTVFAGLSSQVDALRNFAPDAKMAELGFTNIKLLNATLIADPSMASGDLRFINTKFCKLQVLKTPGQQNVGEKPQSIPVSIGEFQKAYNSLHSVSLMYVTLALTCSSLRRQGIATTCA
jgi:hypothetical protein